MATIFLPILDNEYELRFDPFSLPVEAMDDILPSNLFS
jgi:hypothetical protein